MQRPMRRVAVVGSGGAGKSTFARRLGASTGLPVIHLDELYWRPGWVPTPDHEWREIMTRLVSGDAWIIDGNYSRTMDLRAQAADTVLLLDYAPIGNLARALRRTMFNHGRAIQAPGCPEHLDWEFLRWIATYRRRSRPRVLAQLEAAPDLDVRVLRRPRDAQRLLESVAEAGD
jgi:adenylate kinase family enzyme